jgi:hypothetical protein
VFHILDSLPTNTPTKKEARRLQIIFLKHFDGRKFEEGHIVTNAAMVISYHICHSLIDDIIKVPWQPNSYDCGCFLIYFAKKFYSDPLSTMAVIKVFFEILSANLY